MYKLNEKNNGSESKHCIPIHGVYGLAMMFVFVSIAVMATLIFMGTGKSIPPKIIAAPAIAFDFWLMVYKFSRS